MQCFHTIVNNIIFHKLIWNYLNYSSLTSFFFLGTLRPKAFNSSLIIKLSYRLNSYNHHQ